MRVAVASCFAGAGLLALASAASAVRPSPKAASSLQALPKGSAVSVPTPIHIDQGGDTIASALPIGALPFADSGTTAGYVDNYAPTCGFANGAPDVVYSLSPTVAESVTVSLCGSAYDTELYVYEDAQGHVLACDDDFCGLQSQVVITALPGHTYYIIVDGYYNYSGTYTLHVALPPPCVVSCPAGSLLEEEPVCSDDYHDSYNGGCDTVPPIFVSLPFPWDTETVCGTYGGFLYAGLSYRDTDWYQIVVTTPSVFPIIWTVRGEADTLCGIINGSSGCPVTSFYSYAYGPKCTNLTASAYVPPGTWWLWVGTLDFGPSAGPCGQHYVATLQYYQADAVRPTGWGTLKSRYR
ncbi:MAG: hypothetical protein U0167_02895 [bacterium]